MTVSLETIIEPSVLRSVWKDIRGRERQAHLNQTPLVRDSTAGIAFELNLKESLNYLRLRVLDGTYRPHPPLVVESAKSKLLRRRLSFLSLEDALILGALVQSTRPSLMEKMPEWVSFGRVDDNRRQTKKKVITLDYEGWWIKWLRYRKLLKVIEDDPAPFLVVSDVVNFFGSVDLSLLRSKVSGATSLDNRANDLLFYLLERLRPAGSYGPRGSLGLPVVADDTSRILAHFYLSDLDSELLSEGKQGRYTRWVDDMVVSVPDDVQGGQVVARIERALSQIGLVANSSKTDIIPKEKFRRHHHEDHNEYLDGIHESTHRGIMPSPSERREFESRLSQFLSAEREGYWNRVLQRYYTESRRIRSETLLSVWDGHLRELPSNAQSILDYAAFFPGTMDFCMKMFAYLKCQGSLFEDLQILAYEALLLTPFLNDAILRYYVVCQTYHHFLGTNGFDRPSGYVRGVQALTMYKFGGPQSVRLLAPHFLTDAVESPIFASYAFPVVASSDDHRLLALKGVEHIEDSRILRIRTLIERLETGDDRATGMLLGLLEPTHTKLPTRSVVNPRALPLVKIVQRSTNPTNAKRVRDAMNRVVQKVKNKGDPQLVDWVTVSHLQ